MDGHGQRVLTGVQGDAIGQYYYHPLGSRPVVGVVVMMAEAAARAGRGRKKKVVRLLGFGRQSSSES